MDITIKNLAYGVGNFGILKDVSMKIEKGKFTGLIGPNGSGKSTLLKCIYRVNRGYKGDIYLDDRNLSDISIKEGAKLLSVVSQFNDMSFDLTVFDMVALGRFPYKKFMQSDTKEDIEIVSDSIKRVGLSGFENRTMSTLSGGEKQRIILARAIAQQAPIMVLDEPTNHLDIKYQLQLLNLVGDLGGTILAAMHDINLAFMYCDYIYALKGGRIVREGVPDEILDEELIYELYEVKCNIVEDPVTKIKNAHFIK